MTFQSCFVIHYSAWHSPFYFTRVCRGQKTDCWLRRWIWTCAVKSGVSGAFRSVCLKTLLAKAVYELRVINWWRGHHWLIHVSLGDKISTTCTSNSLLLSLFLFYFFRCVKDFRSMPSHSTKWYKRITNETLSRNKPLRCFNVYWLNFQRENTFKRKLLSRYRHKISEFFLTENDFILKYMFKKDTIVHFLYCTL